MLTVILFLILHIFCWFLCLYAQDEPKTLQKIEYDIFSVKQPALEDLKINPKEDFKHTMLKLDSYTKNVILPSEHYYCFYRSITNRKNDNSIVFIFLPLSTFLFIERSFYKTSFFESRALAFSVSLIVTIVVTIIVTVIYKKIYAFKPEEFCFMSYDKNEILESWQYKTYKANCKFDISDDKIFNNFLILKLAEYFKKIEYNMHLRLGLKKSINFVAGAFYLIFFFRIPNL